MMASVGSLIVGSGTSSTRTSRFPWNVTAFIRPPSRSAPGAALLAHGSNQGRLPHLRAPLDSEAGRLASQLGHGHRPGSASRPLRGSALSRGGLGALAAEVAAGPGGELADRPLLARSGLRLLDVLARSLTLLGTSHADRLPGWSGRKPRLGGSSVSGRTCRVTAGRPKAPRPNPEERKPGYRDENG